MPGLDLEPRAGVDRPRPHAPDRLARRCRRRACRRARRVPSAAAARSQWSGVVALPGQVDDAADLLAVAEQDRVAAADDALGALVHLVEVGVASRRPRRPRRRRRAARRAPASTAAARARALGREDEAGEVGAGLGRGGDVLLAREAADLDERPREQLGELRGRDPAPASAPSRRGSRRRRRARPRRPARACGCRSRRRRPRSRGAAPATSSSCVAAVDRERREVARVDPDHRRAEAAAARSSSAASCASTSVSRPSSSASAQQLRGLRVVEVAEQQQHGVGAGLLRRAQVLGRREEALGEQRQARGCARGAQVVPRAAEALVDEDRDRRGAGALVGGGELGRIGVRAEVAERGRAALDLGDRGRAPARRARR